MILIIRRWKTRSNFWYVLNITTVHFHTYEKKKKKKNCYQNSHKHIKKTNLSPLQANSATSVHFGGFSVEFGEGDFRGSHWVRNRDVEFDLELIPFMFIDIPAHTEPFCAFSEMRG